MVAFGVTGLALALTGIYAVITYSINQRAREIGIRLALGATRAGIARLIVGGGAPPIGIGVVAGLAMAAGATRLLATLLFEVNATDITTFAGVAAVVTVVSLFACAVPALRAGAPSSSALGAE